MASEEDEVKCQRCSYKGPQSTFPQKRDLSYAQSCFECREKRAGERDAKRVNDDAPTEKEGTKRGPRVQPKQGFTTLVWDQCVSLIKAHKHKAFELETFVSMTGEGEPEFAGLETGKDIANARTWEDNNSTTMYLD